VQEVDHSLETYLDQEGGERKFGVRERFAVAISSNPAAQQLIARAARMAKRLDGELYVLYVDIGVDDNEANQRTLASNIRFAEAVGAEVAKLKSPTVAKVVAGFVREKHIAQVVFGHSAVKGSEAIPILKRHPQVSQRRTTGECPSCHAAVFSNRNQPSSPSSSSSAN
jgi:K+-sensing histidine kinase KdpD